MLLHDLKKKIDMNKNSPVYYVTLMLLSLDDIPDTYFTSGWIRSNDFAMIINKALSNRMVVLVEKKGYESNHANEIITSKIMRDIRDYELDNYI